MNLRPPTDRHGAHFLRTDVSGYRNSRIVVLCKPVEYNGDLVVPVISTFVEVDIGLYCYDRVWGDEYQFLAVVSNPSDN